jgi:hypothetical protein
LMRPVYAALKEEVSMAMGDSMAARSVP